MAAKEVEKATHKAEKEAEKEAEKAAAKADILARLEIMMAEKAANSGKETDAEKAQKKAAKDIEKAEKRAAKENEKAEKLAAMQNDGTLRFLAKLFKANPAIRTKCKIVHRKGKSPFRPTKNAHLAVRLHN